MKTVETKTEDKGLELAASREDRRESEIGDTD